MQQRQAKRQKRSTFWGGFLCLGMSLILLAGCISTPTPSPTPKTAGEFFRANYTATPTLTPTLPTLTPTPTEVFSVQAGTPLPPDLPQIDPKTAPELKELARWGNGILQDFAWSPDGKWLAAAATRAILLYQPVASGLVQRQSIQGQGILRCVAFSADGSSIAVGEDTGWVSIYRTADGVLLKRWQVTTSAVLSLAFSSAGTLATGSWDGVLRLWDAEGTKQAEFAAPETKHVEKITFAEGGSKLMTWSRSQPLQVWDLQKGKLEKSYIVNKTRCKEDALAVFSADGMAVASSCGEEARVFRLSDGYTLGAFGGFGDGIQALAVSNNGSLLAIGSANSVGLFRLSDGAEIQQLIFEQPTQSIVGLAFSPDSTALAILGEDLALWNFSMISLEQEKHLGFRLDHLAPSAGREWLAAWREGSTQLRVVRVDAEKNVRILKDALTPVMDTVFTADGGYLASAADALRIYDTQNLRRLAVLKAPQEGASYRMRVFHEESGQTTIETLQDQAPLASAAFSADGKLAAAGGYNRAVYLWELPNGDPEQAKLKSILANQEPAVLVDGQPDRDWIRKLVFSDDGSLLAAGWGEQIDIWEVGSGKLLLSTQLVRDGIAAQASLLCHLSFQGSEHRLLAAWQDLSHLYDLENGGLVEESPSLCGMPWGEIADLSRLTLDGAVLRIPQPEGYPMPGSLSYQPAENTLVVERRGGGESWVQFWRVDPAMGTGDILSNTPVSFSPGYALGMAIGADANAVSLLWGNGEILYSSAPDGSEQRIRLPLSAPANLAAVTNDGMRAAFALPKDKLLLAAFSPDGEGGLVQELGSVKATALAFSPDGSLLAAAQESLAVQIWRTEDRTLIQRLELPASLSDSQALVFSADGSRLAARTHLGVVLWSRDAVSGEYGDPAMPFGGNCLAFSADGSLAAVCDPGYGVKQINLYQLAKTEDGKFGGARLVKTLPTAGGSLAFSLDGNLLAVLNMELSVWDIQNGILLARAAGAPPYGRLFFFPKGDLLAAVAADGRIYLYGAP